MLKCLSPVKFVSQLFNGVNVKTNKGFTLIEMMVAVLIFSIVVGAVIGVFVSALQVQRYNLAYQQLLDQTSYAMEYMGRAIRMAVKDDGTCGFSGYNYRVSNGNTKIEFQNYKGDCQEFYLDTSVDPNQLATSKGADYLDIPLTSNNFNVTSLNFRITGAPGSEFSDDLQPRVTIFMEIQGEGAGPQPKITIQTTISQRNLDF